MTALTTTQRFFDEHNMVQGSLSFLTITLADPNHKYWAGSVAAAGPIKAGTVYTITAIGTGSAGDWAGVGLKKTNDAGVAQAPVVGDTFTASSDTNLPTGGTATYDNGDAGLRKVIQNVQSRASIVYIGIADKPDSGDTAGAPGKGKVRLILENRGYQNDEGMDHTRMGEDANDYTSAHAATLLKYLNRQEKTAPDGTVLTDGATTVWDVDRFVF